MVLKVGAWFTEEWLEQAGPRFGEAGFKLVTATTDPRSAGEYQHCIFDYAAEGDMDWDVLVALIDNVKSIVEPLGQELQVRIARSP